MACVNSGNVAHSQTASALPAKLETATSLLVQAGEQEIRIVEGTEDRPWKSNISPAQDTFLRIRAHVSNVRW